MRDCDGFRKGMTQSCAPVPNKPTVSVDIKQHFNHYHKECRDGRFSDDETRDSSAGWTNRGTFLPTQITSHLVTY